MNTYKILNIALIALIITLCLSIFQPKNSAVPTNAVSLSVQNKSVSIPNIPIVSVHNTTTSDVSINTCQDISLTQNSNNVDIKSVAPDFCETKTFGSGTTTALSLEKLHSLFAFTPANYILSMNVGGSVKNIAFDVQKAGIISTFFTTILYNPIYNLFAGLIQYIPGHSLGWAIVAITIIIRLILLYPQQKMLEGQRKMAELQPKIKALQKEYADDRATLGMKVMELYKKENVNPMWSCLPLLIQFPILIALYWVISGISHPSNVYHLYPFLSGFNPTVINTNFFGQNLLQIGGTAALIMALILGITQWVQGYLTVKNQPALPKESPKKDIETDSAMPTIDPKMMQNMTLYFFPLMIGVSALFFPLGLGLYWWIGLLFMIVQQYVVNTQAEKRKLQWEIVRKK